MKSSEQFVGALKFFLLVSYLIVAGAGFKVRILVN